MRSLQATIVVFGWAGALAALGTSGCANRAADCAANAACLEELDDSLTQLDIPDVCKDSPFDNPAAVQDKCGVFVSANSGHDDNPGTMDAPVRTLEKARRLVTNAKPRVYSCAEKFEEAIEVPAGTSLYGGFDCAKRWAMTDSKTLVVAPSGQVPIKLLAGPGLTVIAGVDVRAKPATAPGGSSIAMIIDDVEVKIAYSRFEASKAADGEAGISDSSKLNPAPAGTSGSEACNDVSPGQSGFYYCNGVKTSGGTGGLGAKPDDEPTGGEDGVWGKVSGGKGGEVHWGTGSCPPPSIGQQGPSGVDGMPGAGASPSGVGVLLGSLDMKSGFIGVYGEDGLPGTPGGGGGGGGGRPLATLICSGPGNGESGGGGGAGGCGGKPGRGGQGGGASIALISLGQKSITFNQVELKAGNGGRGGDGGEGQEGEIGGAGGTIAWEHGCPGGNGGKGGKGGRGGGGAGGHSLGIASKYLDFTNPKVVTSIELGQPGLGGTGDGEAGPGRPGEMHNFAIFSN